VIASRSASTERRKLRPVQSVLLAAGASGLAVGLAAAVTVAVLDLTDSVLYRIGVPACALAVFTFGIFRVAVEADEQGLVVTNIWRTHRLSWATVQEINFAGMFWPSAAALFYVFTPLRVRTVDGRSVYIQASIYDVERVTRYLADGARAAGASVRWGFRLD
jgi:hypothetical protein